MKVLILESYFIGAIARLTAGGCEILTAKDAGEAEVILIRSQTHVDSDFIVQFPKLKLIVTATSGFDHINLRATQAHNITVAQTPNANAQSTAELTMSLMLAAERELFQATKNVRGNKWRQGLNRPHGLEGKLLGIIGLGRVGSRVAVMAQAFGMRVQAHDPYVEEDEFKKKNVERIGLIECLKTSDIVSLHVPLTKETKHLLNNPTFEEMQSDAILINTCRGAVVSENDLMVALDEKKIAFAAMDVIEREPPPQGHRLTNHPRLILTPHIGAYTKIAWEKASHEAVDKVLDFKSGKKISDTLPIQAPWFANIE
jgi:D-3-phosphoglycerate dehydrogenase